MYKKKSFITKLICGLPSLLCVGATTVQRFYMDYIYVGPIHSDKNHKSRIIYHLETNTGSLNNKLVNFYVYNSNKPSGSMIRNLRLNNEEGFFDGEFTTYTFVENGPNQVKVFYSDQDGTRTNHYFDLSFDNNYPLVEFNKCPGGVYEVSNVKGYQKDRGYFDTTNKYVFNNYYVDHDANIYSKFDIEKLSFEEYFGLVKVNVTNSTFKIEIPANSGLFSDLTSTETSSNRVVLPLNLINDGTNRYILSFAQHFYVNPLTYEMRRTPTKNYVETRYIYLPKDGLSEGQKIYFNIFGEKLGTMQLDFSYRFYVESNIQRIGNCVTSEYCIRTSDVPYKDVGKEIKND